MLRETLLVFSHWAFCWQEVFHIETLLCWDMLPLLPLWWVFFYHKWVLDFIKCFFLHYWYDYVIFVFDFVYVVYHTYWFVDIVPSLHPWNKSHMIMVYDFFKYIYWLCYYSCPISPPSLHSILPIPSLPHSPTIVHVHG